MKIIRFKEGLTVLILNKKKDMTRRCVGLKEYDVGETLAIAEPYGYIFRSLDGEAADGYYNTLKRELNTECPEQHPGWGNKLFVRPELMLHHIQITGKKREKLQDISDEDIIREGIFHGLVPCRDLETGETGDYTWLDVKRRKVRNGMYEMEFIHKVNVKARDAFANMINHIIGKGAWEKNSEVIAYTFKLID